MKKRVCGHLPFHHIGTQTVCASVKFLAGSSPAIHDKEIINTCFPLFATTAKHSGTSGIKRSNSFHENIDYDKPWQNLEIKLMKSWILVHYVKGSQALVYT